MTDKDWQQIPFQPYYPKPQPPNVIGNDNEPLPTPPVIQMLPMQKPKLDIPLINNVPKRKPKAPINKKILAVIAGIVILGITTGFAFYTYFSSLTPKVEYKNIDFSVKAPDFVPVGSVREWQILVTNKNKVAIRNIEVSLNVEQSFKFRRNLSSAVYDSKSVRFLVDRIEPDKTQKINFEATLVGAVNTNSYFSATMLYKATGNNNKDYSYTLNSERIASEISNAEIKTSIEKTKEVAEWGESFDITYNYENISDRDIENIKVTASYPDAKAFEYISSVLKRTDTQDTLKPTDGNNEWKIDRLARKEKQSLTVKGRVLEGAPKDLTFTFDILTPKSDTDWQTIIEPTVDKIVTTAQPVSLSMTLVGKEEPTNLFTAAEGLNFIINYENKSTKTIQNAEISASFIDPADLLSFSTTSFKTGYGTVSGKTIVFKGASIPALLSVAPGAKGNIEFGISTKPLETISNTSLPEDKFNISFKTEFTSPDKNIISFENKKIYKLASALDFQQSVIITDKANSSFKDVAGEFKVAQIKWTFKTRHSKLKNIQVDSGTILAATGDIWNDASVRPIDGSEKPVYGGSTNGKISLRIAGLDNFLGIAKEAAVYSFELKIFPDGRTGGYTGIQILKDTVVSGTDSLTGKLYTNNIQPISGNSP
jgi:hypothetical protein